jgi:hypothetical protein
VAYLISAPFRRAAARGARIRSALQNRVPRALLVFALPSGAVNRDDGARAGARAVARDAIQMS